MLKQVIDIFELLDDANINGEKVREYFLEHVRVKVSIKKIVGDNGSTDFIKIVIPGKSGKMRGGHSPTLGIIGRLGGIGARPEKIGLVSDADGAIAALSVALKLAEMTEKGDDLYGDVIICTHICPNAPTLEHKPVSFMGSPVDMKTMNANEVDPSMDAIISIDATKGNRINNMRGFAITPIIKEGWILPIPDSVIDIFEVTTGRRANVLSISTQDLTPYGNGLYHINSILQPSTATNASVMGVAITAETVVPGSSTGANHEMDISEACMFCIEIAKSYGNMKLEFFNSSELKTLKSFYGSMEKLMGGGNV